MGSEKSNLNGDNEDSYDFYSSRRLQAELEPLATKIQMLAPGRALELSAITIW